MPPCDCVCVVVTVQIQHLGTMSVYFGTLLVFDNFASSEFFSLLSQVNFMLLYYIMHQIIAIIIL